MAKKTFVALTVKIGDKAKTQEFEIKHAQRILSMPKNGGWSLPTDSKFKLVEGELVPKTAPKAKK